MTFKPVSPKVDFVKIEQKLLKWWYGKGIVKKYLHKNDKSPKRFRFLDGPITANNPMGVHHAWGRTYKDLWQRYKNMQGYKQRFQNGFDNQGLWVEVEVEKELGFKSKKDIEKYGIEKFVKKCKERTLKFAKVQTEQSKRLGYFMDWENSYHTMSDENNYMIWHFLKKCHQKGYLYKGLDSVPWCPRCGTAISQHEILTEEYHELTHKAVYFKLPIADRKNEYLLVWTTTPWTLPANVAVAVNPKLTYVKVKQGKEIYYLSEGTRRVLKGAYKILEKFSGKKLVGFTYQGPFDELPVWQDLKTTHQVVAADFVGEEEGTGLVHIAPGAGHEDFVLAKEKKLAVIIAIDEEANYVAGFDWLTGKNAAKKPDLILNALKKRGFVYRIENYTHRYPVCWRCKTELVFRAVDEWYISMDDLRHKMMKVTKKIRWIPSFGLERELDWLRNMQDWLISKKRYWGLALPIWECSCGNFEVIGSKEELKKKAVAGWKKFSGHTPHRPWVDEVKIKCSKCGKMALRIADVGNPWLDAGIVSFSTLKYQTQKKYWQDWFPADFITESFPGQFKNWFYSLLAMSTVLENREPFKTVLGFATLLAEDGRAMHKSLGNAIEFNEGADKIGVDVMRWMYATQNPSQNLLFGYHLADETRRRFHLMLWNVYNFFVTYANIDNWKPRLEIKKKPTKLDLWILTRLDETIITVTESLDDYDAQNAALAIEEFVQDLSLWYVRRSRDRVGPTAVDKDDKDLAYATLYTILVILSQILAPFTPFLAEELYKNLTGEESVHLSDWPEVKTRQVLDQKLLEQMEMVRKICELGHAARKEAKIKVRQPLQLIKVKSKDDLKPDRELVQLIKEELNVKDVEFVKGKDELSIKLDEKITPGLAAEGKARELVRQIQELRKKAGFKLDQKIIVYAPAFPEEEELKDYIMRKTLAKKLVPGKRLRITS